MSGERIPEKNGPEAEPQIDSVRQKVDEYLAGCQGVRDGTYDAYFIEVSEAGEALKVDTECVDQIEGYIRNFFGDTYPDLIEY